MAKVEIYTKDWCPYCVRAKRLLNEVAAEIEEYAVDRGGNTRSEMIQRAGGRTTVPQIFIDGRHIGGCDDLFALQSSGTLTQMLDPQRSSGQA